MIACFLIFLSNCKNRGHDTYNPYSVKELEEESIHDDNDNKQIYRDQINESLTSIIDLIHPLVRKLVEQPDILFITGQSAETRACPDTEVTGSFPGTKTLTLTFDEDGTSCDVVTGAITKTYAGTLVFELVTNNATWGGDADDLIILKHIMTPFLVDNFSFLTSGDYTFQYNESEIIQAGAGADITVENTSTNAVTLYTFGATGTGFLSILLPTISFPITDPSALLNQPYTISTADATNQGVGVICISTTGDPTQGFSVSAQDLVIQPNVCGCFTDGKIYTTDFPSVGSGVRAFDALTSISFDFQRGGGLCYVNNGGVNTGPPSGEPSNDVGLILPGQSGLWDGLKVGSGQLSNCCFNNPTITVNGITFILNTGNVDYETFQSNGSDNLRRRVVFFRENNNVGCSNNPSGPPAQSMNWEISGLDPSSAYSLILFGQDNNGNPTNPADFSIDGHDAGNGTGNPVTLDAENDGNFVVENPTNGVINGTFSIQAGTGFSSWSGLQIRRVVVQDFAYDNTGNINTTGCDEYYSNTGGITFDESTACQ